MVRTEHGLVETDLPGLYEAADTASRSGQRQYVRTVRLRLLLTIAAAVTGTWPAETSGLDVAALGTAAALAAIAVTEANLRTTRPAERWYDGRALAESAKSLAWRYSVGGVPYAKQGNDKLAERRLVEQMSRLLDEAPTTCITPSLRPTVTAAMHDLRSRDLATRKEAYLRFRIADQQAWYAGKAVHNERRATQWHLSLLVIEVLGIAAALAKALRFVDLNLAGVVAAVIAAGTAWASLRQHTTLARAYTFAANELAIARSRLDLVDDEETWAAEVADSEEAVSREHTMWRASRSRPN
ncbi:DUF4231 domain-containing protein [Kutzneria sp. NPDC052558]|uniref:DUF4231 domain-containing protein n=1 Tax=Kutzneria sp. NPDC052558 TaxID=3364121 RepID=UPI0037C9059B